MTEKWLDEPNRGGTGFQPVIDGRRDHATSRRASAEEGGSRPTQKARASSSEPHASSTDSRISSIFKRRGAYLPHWSADCAIYSVTFRLADSLPKSVVEAWKSERESLLRAARHANRPLSESEKNRLRYLFSVKVDRYMDAGHGFCWLNQDAIARIVADALLHFDGDRYRLWAWCVMPNHVHVVVQPLPGYELAEIVRSWKTFAANRANKALNHSGGFWQPEYYDHLIRDESDLAHSIEYVLHNPERAGLSRWTWVGGRVVS